MIKQKDKGYKKEKTQLPTETIGRRTMDSTNGVLNPVGIDENLTSYPLEYIHRMKKQIWISQYNQ